MAPQLSDGALKNKYKQLKYAHLKRLYEKRLSKLPTNCKYNKQIKLPSGSLVNICGFNLEDMYEVDLCYKKEHSQSCNAFCPKKSKEELYAEFLNALKDDQIRATYYKDINTLYWLDPKLSFEEFPDKNTWFYRAKLWFYSLFSSF